jgi:hypothetical protein
MVYGHRFPRPLLPDSLAGKAIAGLEKNCGIKAVHDGTISGLKSYMKTCGVDKSVVLPVATKPSQVKTINEWAKNSGDDSLIFFGAVHPDDADFHDVVLKLKDDGFRGVKLHPDYQGFFADEKRMMPLYEGAARRGAFIVFHAGSISACLRPCTALR